MMYEKIFTSIGFLLFGFVGLNAQETISITGGEATGTGGNVSYTMGQVNYNTQSGTNGSVSQGVQQPYEIVTSIGQEIKTIQLELAVYPNPTNDYLMLKIVDEFTDLRFQLFDLNGRLIQSDRVTDHSTTISMADLSMATYFLKVSKNHQLVKSFTIVKN